MKEYEARCYGADAILLITALLESNQLKDYIAIADSLKMDCLVESHNEQDLERSIECGAQIYGINNRNLHTFETDLETTPRLIKGIPKGYPIVTESGIFNYNDVSKLFESGRVNAMLIGEGIMSKKINPTTTDMEKKIFELRGIDYSQI